LTRSRHPGRHRTRAVRPSRSSGPLPASNRKPPGWTAPAFQSTLVAPQRTKHSRAPIDGRHAVNNRMEGSMEKATFAGGSFWGLEDAFAGVKGVLSTRVGYTGGTVPNPTHEQVRHGDTGHAQAVEVTFDPEQVSYDDLLEVFWKSHDPTQLNRQGADIGSAY